LIHVSQQAPKPAQHPRSVRASDLHLTSDITMAIHERPAAPLPLRLKRLVRSKVLWALVLTSFVFVAYLRRLDAQLASPDTSKGAAVRSDTRTYTSGPSFPPPSWERLRTWERELPQHNYSLPFPEGRKGRYVRFTNQVRAHVLSLCVS
jgi:hypothetical protein